MIAIVKYNAGNITSVKNAIERLGFECIVTDDSNELEKADKVIFPGVGEASSAMEYLKEKGLDEVIKNLKQPFLGICLGMQLMCDYSEEGNADCLGIFKTNVKKFPPLDLVPQMGWNTIYQNGNESERKEIGLFKNVNEDDDVYFVHSYYAEVCEDTVATCDYILNFSAALQKDNFYGVQFHPEKSGKVGEEILREFLILNF
jgi:glutamine amidotransferase